MGTEVTTAAEDRDALMMEEMNPSGWRDGRTCEPGTKGLYERRSALGITVDYFDGEKWIRQGHRGVECANQDLDWREVLH